MTAESHPEVSPALPLPRPHRTSVLDGVVVVDFSLNIPGPFATKILADAGATVLKVEPPNGDPLREHAPPGAGTGTTYSQINAGKIIMTADLKDPGDLAQVLSQVKDADVLVEGFRPGTMARLGLGYDVVTKMNPGIVYCSLSGYGSAGPRAGWPGHDANFLSELGLLPQPTHYPSPPPNLYPAAIGAAMSAAFNIVLSLFARRGQPTGAHLDIALIDALYSFGFESFATGTSESGETAPLVEGVDPRYALYQSKDGCTVVVGASEEHHWAVFCELIGLPEENRRNSDSVALAREVQQRLALRDADHWRQVFESNPCCVSVEATVRQASKVPHFQQRGLFEPLNTPDGREITALPSIVAPSLRRQDSQAVSNSAR